MSSMSIINLQGQFTGTGASASVPVTGVANLLLSFNGASATVEIQRSFDGGSTWYTLSKDSTPNPASYTDDINASIDEFEYGVLYRFNCTSYTSGTITYRLSR